MNVVKKNKNNVYLSQSFEATFPAAPFPRKYVHCVFDDVHDAVQAVFTLIAADYDANNVHVLTSQGYLEALERRQTLIGFLTSMDLKEYVQKISRGNAILVVRPSSYGQIMQVRHLLAPHHAHLMKYIDTWTTAELLA